MYFSLVAPSDRKVNIYEAIEKKKKKERNEPTLHLARTVGYIYVSLNVN